MRNDEFQMLNVESDISAASWAAYRALQSPSLRAFSRLRVELRRLERLWTTRRAEIVKRAVDIILSAIALLLLSPLFLLIALCIKIEDPGPAFFAQTRVGKHGRTFKMFKFRSMCVDAEQRLKDLLALNQHVDGVTFKIKDDPRITRVGRVLRKLSFDELPQFYNVLRGDMTLVGPRPPVPREVALYTIADRRRLAAVPGITCIWQISGRSEIDFSGQVKLDVEYIEKQSLGLDLKILAKTLPAVLSAKGAC
jgi:lipopolysaccharide/colanic/teichoic acid biosynthesis glycosyltransferase